ncbi:hypothetical protein DERF_008718 [Dermatophagoides farinae]|uniref:Uncharacterized protein n=1 Tax=Dermatophagoides farinae TaxID=6954 RepID=A0A922I0Y9_DERFA|nr:hypothetical protein DERF_008718 [Dermatophagoides farinae]
MFSRNIEPQSDAALKLECGSINGEARFPWFRCLLIIFISPTKWLVDWPFPPPVATAVIIEVGELLLLGINNGEELFDDVDKSDLPIE